MTNGNCLWRLPNRTHVFRCGPEWGRTNGGRFCRNKFCAADLPCSRTQRQAEKQYYAKIRAQCEKNYGSFATIRNSCTYHITSHLPKISGSTPTPWPGRILKLRGWRHDVQCINVCHDESRTTRGGHHKALEVHSRASLAPQVSLDVSSGDIFRMTDIPQCFKGIPGAFGHLMSSLTAFLKSDHRSIGYGEELGCPAVEARPGPPPVDWGFLGSVRCIRLPQNPMVKKLGSPCFPMRMKKSMFKHPQSRLVAIQLRSNARISMVIAVSSANHPWSFCAPSSPSQNHHSMLIRIKPKH